MFKIPYGKTFISIDLPHADLIAPRSIEAARNPTQVIQTALDHSDVGLEQFRGVPSAAIAINDKTRPVPHDQLLPPLLERLEKLGLSPASIILVIATGTHPPMTPDEFHKILPTPIYDRYPVISHDAENLASLVYLGETPRGTPVHINRQYAEAALKIVVGNIEPHQFMGFSGGVKSAAVGLTGKATINHNHAMMTDPNAKLGEYELNPARQDVEDIGRLIGIHFALNAILNQEKQIVTVVAGDPRAVMQAGIPLVKSLYQVPVSEPYDIVIASPGGSPKDLNLYQAQKALAHAALITRPGGSVILAAACPEGTGSQSYEKWMTTNDEMTDYEAVFARFAAEGFHVGPHKAYQIARDAAKVRTFLMSEMPDDLVRRLLLEPVHQIEDALAQVSGERIAVMPIANATVPLLLHT